MIKNENSNTIKVYMTISDYLNYINGAEVKTIEEHSSCSVQVTINKTDIKAYNPITDEYLIKKSETNYNKDNRNLPKVKSDFDFSKDEYYIMRIFKDGYFAITDKENRDNLDKVEAVL